MKPSELKPSTIFRVTGGEGGYWLYTGNHPSMHTCHFCRKVREYTHEFLHYKTLSELKHDLLIGDLGRFDVNLHFGSECVKNFVDAFSIDDIV